MKTRAYLQLTKACNLKCKMCDFWKNSKENLKKGYFIDIIDIFIDNNIKGITFWWWEPFLNKDIYDLISYSKSKGLNTEIITNWVLINKERIKVVIKDLDEIIFSIDSWFWNIHEEIRWKKWVYEIILNNLEYLVELRDKINPKLKIIIDTTIQKDNFKTIWSIFEIAYKYWIKLNFDPVQVIWYWNEKTWNNLLLTEDEAFEFEKDFLGLWDKNQAYIVQSKDSIKRIIKYLKWYKIENYCSSLNRDLLLDPYWNVLKCWWNGEILYNILENKWKIKQDKLKMTQYCYNCWFTHVRDEDYFDWYSVTNNDFEKNIY